MISGNYNNKNFISVIMSYYNSEKYIKQSINSILKQTHNNLELILLDDGSTDNSSKIVDQFFDKRIIKFKNINNSGVPFSFNKLISKAKGEYIAFMDSDDISVNNRLETQLNFLLKNNLDVCGSSAKTFGSFYNNKIPIIKNNLDISFLMCFGNPIVNSSTLFKSKVLKNFKCNESLISWDFDLYSNIVLSDYSIGNISEVLLLSRQHNSQDSKINYKKGIKESEIISRNHFKNIKLKINKKYIENINFGYSKDISFFNYEKAIININYLIKKFGYQKDILRIINLNLIINTNILIKDYFKLIYINRKLNLKIHIKHLIFIFLKIILKIKYNGLVFKTFKIINFYLMRKNN